METKNCHVVAQSYLSGFSFDDDFTYATRRKNNRWSEIFKPKVKDICREKNFYALLEKGGFTTDILEKKFSKKIENKWKNLILELENFPFAVFIANTFDRDFVLAESSINVLSKFILLQKIRTPSGFAYMYPHVGDFLDKKTLKQLRKAGITKKIFSHQVMARAMESFLDDTSKSEELFRIKRIRLMINANTLPFITSNAPCVWFSHKNKNVIYVPLSSKFAIEVRSTDPADRSIIVGYVDLDTIKDRNRLLANFVKQENSNKSMLISNNQEALDLAIKPSELIDASFVVGPPGLEPGTNRL